MSSILPLLLLKAKIFTERTLSVKSDTRVSCK